MWCWSAPAGKRSINNSRSGAPPGSLIPRAARSSSGTLTLSRIDRLRLSWGFKSVCRTPPVVYRGRRDLRENQLHQLKHSTCRIALIAIMARP